MWIIGCDLHTRYQQVAAINKETGELIELRLEHAGDAVRLFYAALPKGSMVGIESLGYTQWFERLLTEWGHELWIGDAAEIRAASVRHQKTDIRDARLILQLLDDGRFPRLWLPSAEDRDARRLLLHRVKTVQMRTMARNQLHALALNQGLRRGSGLWSQRGQRELAQLQLGRFSSEMRQGLMNLTKTLDERIEVLNHQVAEQAEQRPGARYLMQQPGVGPMTALGFVLTIGPVTRFRRSKQVVSYLGLNPREYSSGGRQKLGKISKQGNTLMRWLLIEAAQTAARLDPQLHCFYLRLKHRRGARVAKVAVARKLAVRLYWMLRTLEAEGQAQRVGPQGSPSTIMARATTPPNS